MKKNLIRKFRNLKKSDTNIAGGKGASLGEMTNANIPVPNGFVVLTDSFEEFLKKTKLKDKIDDILSKIDKDKNKDIEKVSKKIRKLILKEEIPKDIKEKIISEFDELNAEYVAVRSSATAEDSLNNAWAGQLDSFLNVKKENLNQSVKKCWASLFTPRAIFYRFEKGLDDTKISVAVVVQKMVNSEKSGIAFSVHPVSQNRDEIIIEAGLGLGEAIVSGTITPDSYIVSKSKNEIVEKNINKQTKALYRKQDGGNEWIDLGEKEKEQVLSEKEILDLAEIVKKIENHYGVPQDIEWAFEDGKFYIVQSRPITTLKEREEYQEYRAVLTRPFSVLRMDFQSTGEFFGIKHLTKNNFYFKPFFVYSKDTGTTAYYNFSSDQENIEYIINFLNKNIPFVKEELIKAKKACKFLENAIKLKQIKFPKKVFNAMVQIQPFSSLGNLIGYTSFASKELSELFIKYRYDYDGLAYRVEKYLLEQGEKNIKDDLKKYIKLLSFEELFYNKEIKDLKKRENKFIFYMGNIVTTGLNDFLSKNLFFIKEKEIEHNNYIKGISAYRGTKTGTVKKIFTLKDVEKFKEGDILVSPMTIPDFIPAMKKAAAFITDEGGITCHAAIIAREMKRPTIIGTKNATTILNDGDYVEVDANQGIVKIIKKKIN